MSRVQLVCPWGGRGVFCKALRGEGLGALGLGSLQEISTVSLMVAVGPTGT